MAPSAPLRIHLLGGLRVLIDGRPVAESAWRLQRARTLVELLALAPGHQLRRPQLAAQFWPDVRTHDAANNLRATLYAARRALASVSPDGSGWITADRTTVALAPRGELWIDVEAFDAAADTALRSSDPAVCWDTIALYHGDLLPVDPYNDQIAARGEALHARYLALLLHTAYLHEQCGEVDRAIDALRRVVEVDPAYERAHYGLMRLYAMNGDRHRAVRQYQLLCDVLRFELDVEPEPATVELYKQILEWRFALPRVASGSASGPGGPGGSGAMVRSDGNGQPSSSFLAGSPTVVAVGPRPLTLAIHQGAQLLYVAQSGGREVWAIETESFGLSFRMETSNYPHGLAVNQTLERVYVASYLGRRIVMLDARTGAWLRRADIPRPKLPWGIAVDPIANRVYVTTRRNAPADDPVSDALLVLDGETLDTMASLSVGSLPMGVAVDPGARLAFVANVWSDTVSVVDTERNEVIGSVPVGKCPTLLALNEASGRVYVSNSDGDSVSVIDCAAHQVVATIQTGARPRGIAINAATNQIYVANTDDGTLSVIDGTSNTFVATIPVGRMPVDIALDASGRRLFVANFDADTITVIDTSSFVEPYVTATGTTPDRTVILAEAAPLPGVRPPLWPVNALLTGEA